MELQQPHGRSTQEARGEINTMATTDYIDISSPCPCGQSTITVTQASPDHPWVKASQISYSATIDCEDCQQEYVVRPGYGTFPYLVKLVDFEAFAEAQKACRAAEQSIAKSIEADALRTRISEFVDSKTSMAAKHRALKSLGLAYESIGTYRKRPYSGAKAAARAHGSCLARIGSKPEFGGSEVEFFKNAREQIEQLYEQERKLEPKAVKTGAKWLQY